MKKYALILLAIITGLVHAPVSANAQFDTDMDSMAVTTTDTLPYPQYIVKRLDTLLTAKMLRSSRRKC